MRTRRKLGLRLALAMGASWPGLAMAQDGLLFRMSADAALEADTATGQAEPTFADKVAIVPTGGVRGGYLRAQDDQVLAWSAPGNIQAQRGTLSFFWRAREPIGANPFPLFRVGYADHSSWDMVFLRIDWNGAGFDAFVTDTSLARVRVSWAMPQAPAPDVWTHIAFAWDETTGVKLYVNGRLVQRKDQPALLDAGLDQFGPHSRIISPQQVQSRYNFLRGGDLDELRIYDRALDDAAVAALARADAPVPVVGSPDWVPTWTRRLGFDGPLPDYLDTPFTHIRRVEFSDQRDVAQRMWKGNDGIRETTWPGVYNRSRLAGRNDYFQLPDWNVYSMGGKSATWFLPDEPWNQIEVQGAAHGRLEILEGAAVPPLNQQVADRFDQRFTRPQGVERTTTRLSRPVSGGAVRFVNTNQETPISEIGVYNVTEGRAPAGIGAFDVFIRSQAEPDYSGTADLTDFIAGRYPLEERATVAALPAGAQTTPRSTPLEGARPMVHVVIPQDFRTQPPGRPLTRNANYGFENFGGLDGIELTLPAMSIEATQGGLIPLNIRIKDPLAPQRDLMDVNVSVRPGEARTLWLDTRDRILPANRGLYLTLASSQAGFSAQALEGARIRLVFKSRQDARAEHERDRFEQVRDNYGFIVEERQSNRDLGLYKRFYADLTDLLRVNPEHPGGMAYWSEWNPQQPVPPVQLAPAPAGVPAWAWGQTQALGQVSQFVNWWIDYRQVEGEFGGGLSDDSDLLNQWPGLALMGVEPDKINASLNALIDAIYRNGMFTNGLGTITTDELHVYEEGINAISQAYLLNRGDPLTVERLMETAVRFQDLTEVNAAGHRHFVSNNFGGNSIVREAPWQWSKPHSYLMLHPGLMLVDYNGSPRLRELLLELADGYLAHGVQDPAGNWSFPPEINWPDDATRGTGGPQSTNLLMWAAWRWTSDTRYLRPLEQALRTGGPDALSSIISTDLAHDIRRPELNQALLAAAAGDANAYTLNTAWQVTGDKAYLERLFDRQRRSNTLRMPMMTEDQWWSDRVEIPSQELQRQRLGGIALWRNTIVPGHLISWRFGKPDDARQLGVLVREPTATGFRVIAHNLSAAPITATITGAQVSSGTWSVSQGLDGNDDDRIDSGAQTREAAFGAGLGLPATFPPGQTTVMEFRLTSAPTDIRTRPDIGIASRDLRWTGRNLTVTVHSLGAVDAQAGRVILEAADGRILAQTTLPALDAPNDLRAKTANVALAVPRSADLTGAVVRVSLNEDELTLANNHAVVPSR